MSRGATRSRIIKAYLSIPRGIRKIPDKLIRNRGSAQEYLNRHSAKGKVAFNNLVKVVTKPVRKRRR